MAIDASALLSHFRRHRRWTCELVAACPEEFFEWVPEGAGFSCGGLVRHLMQAEAFWVRLLRAAAAGEVYDPFGLAGPFEERVERFRDPNLDASRNDRFGATFAECLEAWNGMQKKTETVIAALDERDLEETLATHPLTGLKAPLWEMVIVMMEHEAHHRGQLSAYMKSRGAGHPTTLWS